MSTVSLGTAFKNGISNLWNGTKGDLQGASNGLATLDPNYQQQLNMSKYNNELAEKTWNREKAKEFAYSQQAEKNSATNQLAGLTQAGFSPNSMLGGFDANVASGGSPSVVANQGNAGTFTQGVSQLGQLALNAKAQRELLEAQADNIRADTYAKGGAGYSSYKSGDLAGAEKARIDRVNKFNKDTDMTALALFKEEYPEVWQELVKQKFNGDEKLAFDQTTIGVLEGTDKYADMTVNVKKKAVEKEVQEYILGSPDVIESMATMSQTEQQHLRANINELSAQAGLLREQETQLKTVEAQLKQASIDKNKKQIEVLEKQKSKIEQDIKESQGRIDRMASEKFRNYTSGVRDIVGSATDVINTAKTPVNLKGTKDPTAGDMARMKDPEHYGEIRTYQQPEVIWGDWQ